MAAGQSGFLDWVGYPVGRHIPPPLAGYYGIIDWTGIPCGVHVDPPSPPAPARETAGGGLLLLDEQPKRRRDPERKTVLVRGVRAKLTAGRPYAPLPALAEPFGRKELGESVRALATGYAEDAATLLQMPEPEAADVEAEISWIVKKILESLGLAPLP